MKLLKYMALILFVIIIIIFYRFFSSIDTSGYKDPSRTDVIEVPIGDVMIKDERWRFAFDHGVSDRAKFYEFRTLLSPYEKLPDISHLPIKQDLLSHGQLFLMSRDRFPMTFMPRIMKDINAGNAEALPVVATGFDGFKLPYYPESTGHFTYVLVEDLALNILNFNEVYVTCRGEGRVRFDGATGPLRHCKVHAPVSDRTRVQYDFIDDAPWSPEHWPLLIKIIDHTLGQHILIEDKKPLNVEPTQH